MKKTGIILINYKDYARKFLSECRESIRMQSYPSHLINVYIVDNVSSQESREYLENEYPEATLLAREDGNYTAANNLGIKKAIEDNCEYLVIANMDTKFDKAWLLELVEPLKADWIGIAQSKIMLYPGDANFETAKINSIGNIIHFLGFGFTKGYNLTDKNISGYPEIDYASGCSLAIRKNVLSLIGGYNEDYYMYHDDLEMSWKTRLAGLKVVLAPKSIVYHKYEFSRSVRMLYFMERNRVITFFSFYRLPTIILILPALLLMDLGMLFYSVVNGWFLIKLKIYLYFLNPYSWLKIYRNRQKIKRIRKLKDKRIVKSFSGKVLFQEINNPVLERIANPFFDKYWKIVRKLIWW